MKDKAFASAVLLLAGTVVLVLSWQSYRIRKLEALSASLSASLAKCDESTVQGTKSPYEALRGLKFDLGENRCLEGACRLDSGKGAGHVLP